MMSCVHARSPDCAETDKVFTEPILLSKAKTEIQPHACCRTVFHFLLLSFLDRVSCILG